MKHYLVSTGKNFTPLFKGAKAELVVLKGTDGGPQSIAQFYNEDDAYRVADLLDKLKSPSFDRDLLTVFKQTSFPSNPLPFLNALSAGVRANGTDWIASDEAKALLWVVMAQSFKTQIIAISMHEEWRRLNKIF